MKTGHVLLIGASAIALVGFGYLGVRTNMARTIRLNNPGGLRINPANNWQGKVTPSRDPEFETFETPVYGARAMLRTLRSHYQRGENTVIMLIKFWTPDNQAGYIKHVITQAGLGSSGFFTWNEAQVCKIAKAMADWEAGVPYYSEQLFHQAWAIM